MLQATRLCKNMCVGIQLWFVCLIRKNATRLFGINVCLVLIQIWLCYVFDESTLF